MIFIKPNESVKDLPNKSEWYYCYRGFTCDHNNGFGWLSELKKNGTVLFKDHKNETLLTDWYYDIRNLKTDKDFKDLYFFQVFNEGDVWMGDYRVDKKIFDQNMVPPFNNPKRPITPSLMEVE